MKKINQLVLIIFSFLFILSCKKEEDLKDIKSPPYYINNCVGPVIVKKITRTSAEISWRKPLTDNPRIRLVYEIYDKKQLIHRTSDGSTSYTLDSLMPNKQYEFNIIPVIKEENLVNTAPNVCQENIVTFTTGNYCRMSGPVDGSILSSKISFFKLGDFENQSIGSSINDMLKPRKKEGYTDYTNLKINDLVVGSLSVFQIKSTPVFRKNIPGINGIRDLIFTIKSIFSGRILGFISRLIPDFITKFFQNTVGVILNSFPKFGIFAEIRKLFPVGGFFDNKVELSYKIYIDFNDNGDFEEDPSELVLDVINFSGTTVTGEIDIPEEEFLIGSHRMRVVLKKGGSIDSACGAYDNGGEVEDYTINIVSPTPCESEQCGEPEEEPEDDDNDSITIVNNR